MTQLGPNRYGKSEIRLVRIDRGVNDRVRDLTIAISLEGDFERVHTAGDNSPVVATDTMKNTAYAFARDRLAGSIEQYAISLAEHFVRAEAVHRATVRIQDQPWQPIETPDGAAAGAFVRSGSEIRVAEVVTAAGGSVPIVRAGFEGLTLMKSRGSAFTGFPRDPYTTLAETEDRLMASRVAATWTYDGEARSLDHDATFAAIRSTILEVFAEHESPSVQATIWILGRAVLDRHPAVAEVTMAMPNLHHWLVDLGPFGLDNPDEVYVATAQPYGLIEATVRRSG